MRTRVKICGITRVADGLQAAHLGADAIGLVFYGPSPRAVTPVQAREIVAALPPFVTTVGLFVDAAEEQIQITLEQVPLDLLQFHGNESPLECRRYGRPYIKALRMREDIGIKTEASNYHDAAGILLDTYQKGVVGGTGQTFDWTRIPVMDVPLILAGGLNARNVSSAVKMVKPYAVDVSGGVEQEKGIKDYAKMAEFINEVQSIVTT